MLFRSPESASRCKNLGQWRGSSQLTVSAHSHVRLRKTRDLKDLQQGHTHSNKATPPNSAAPWVKHIQTTTEVYSFIFRFYLLLACESTHMEICAPGSTVVRIWQAEDNCCEVLNPQYRIQGRGPTSSGLCGK